MKLFIYKILSSYTKISIIIYGYLIIQKNIWLKMFLSSFINILICIWIFLVKIEFFYLFSTLWLLGAILYWVNQWDGLTHLDNSVQILDFFRNLNALLIPYQQTFGKFGIKSLQTFNHSNLIFHLLGSS